MVTMNRSSARTAIDVAEASEIARMARSDDPNILSRDDMESLLGNSAMVLDGLRRRPRYFDGRFLTGADMTRDQDYIRQRQADLARASGSGVVNGLEVGMVGSPGGEMLTITPGHGITPTGDIVTVMTRRSIAPLDLPAVERLDASMGLRLAPAVPLGRRTGLFLLVLRSVEFTANPIAAYPTSITGPRRIEDGDVIEATAITLIPYPDTGGAANLSEARRAVARRLFLGEARGLPQDALPLAMIGMERGAIRWIDTAMVRRETGADTPLQVGMGARPRALSEAFVLQHRRHLVDVLHERASSGLPSAFAAAQYFSALPAAGQVPASAILTDSLGFRQLWFPPAVDVDLSFVPADEVAALVEESLTLPPIDLLGDPLDLDATGVVVLAPVSRQRLQRFDQALTQLSMKAESDPGQGIRRAPMQMLAALLTRRTKYAEAALRDAEAQARAEAADAEIRTWQAAWAEAISGIPAADGMPPLLWYVRRRAVPYASRVAGIAVAVTGDDEGLKRRVDERLAKLGLDERVAAVAERSTPFAEARILSFLGAPAILGSTILMASAVHDLESIVVRQATLETADGGTGDTPPIVSPKEDTATASFTAAPTSRLAADVPGAQPASAAATPFSASTAKSSTTKSSTAAATTSLASKVSTNLTTTATTAAAKSAARPGLNRLAAFRAVASPITPIDLISEGDVIDVASDYADPRLGEGLDRITTALDAKSLLPQAAQLWLGETGQALELDRAARDVKAASLAKFATALVNVAEDQDADALALLIAKVD